MSNLTLNGWKVSTTNVLISRTSNGDGLPMQDFDSAFAKVESYLSSVGGWNPDDVGDPTGPGVPASGESPEQAVGSIFSNELDNVYHLSVEGNLTFGLQCNVSLSPGLSDEDVLSLSYDYIVDVLNKALEDTNVSVIEVSSDIVGTVMPGYTTAEQRQNIAILSGTSDPKEPYAIALKSAKEVFSLNGFYNAEYLYTEPNRPLFILIRKYTDNTFSDIDQTVSEQYNIKLNPTTYQVIGGHISTI